MRAQSKYTAKKKNKLQIIYEDNGIRIAEDQKELIFKEGYDKGTGYPHKKNLRRIRLDLKEHSNPKKGA